MRMFIDTNLWGEYLFNIYSWVKDTIDDLLSYLGLGKRSIRVGLVVTGIIASVLIASMPVCYVTTIMPPRDLFDMGPVASAIGSLTCIVTAILT